MADQSKPRKGLDRFTKDVLYSALVNVTSKALVGAALALTAALAAVVVTGGTVPAWTLVGMTLVAIALVYLTRRATGRETRELRPALRAAEGKLDRHDSYGSNLCSVLDTFQKINANDIAGMTMREFIDRGILIPARDVMRENGHTSDLRMSVLVASDGHFSMVWASGHQIESQRKYRVPVDQTISRVAFEKRAPQVWKNAPEEERGFMKNPKATRGFKSMVSIPILMGDETHGVFNSVTDRENAFDPADISYLTSLGAVIQLAFGMAVAEVRSNGPQTKGSTDTGGPASGVPQRTLPDSAPNEHVGSQGSADRMEASDG